jgi:hypothetical protein
MPDMQHQACNGLDSVMVIVADNRRVARLALDGLVLELQKTVVQAIGVRDQGAIDISASERYRQAAVILMAQLTQSPKVQGTLTEDDGSIRFQLSWDLTEQKP